MNEELEADIGLQMSLCQRIYKTYENLKKERQERRTKGFLVAKRNEFANYEKKLTENHEKIYSQIPAKNRKSEPYILNESYEQGIDSINEANVTIEEWLDAINSTVNILPSGQLSNIPVQINARAEPIRLPRITIEHFYGDYHKWLTFKNLFINLIHSKHEISSVEKFHHLLTSTNGEAKRLIAHYAITEENYNSAWQDMIIREH